MKSLRHWFCCYGLLVLTSGALPLDLWTAAAQEGNSMQPGTLTLFASADNATTKISDRVCVALTPLPAAKFLHREAATMLVLQQLHSLNAASSGPFVVYLESSGTVHPLSSNRLGYFSLYSFQARADGQDISFSVEPHLLHQLLSQAPGHTGLRVCVENRNPSRQDNPSPSATFARVLLVQVPKE
jgi:hypothetical protein